MVRVLTIGVWWSKSSWKPGIRWHLKEEDGRNMKHSARNTFSIDLELLEGEFNKQGYGKGTDFCYIFHRVQWFMGHVKNLSQDLFSATFCLRKM